MLHFHTLEFVSHYLYVVQPYLVNLFTLFDLIFFFFASEF